MAMAIEETHPLPAELQSNMVGGGSHNSSSTDVSRLALVDGMDDHSRTHHLLKHCLSDGQRGEALAHFSSDDVKEAAKEISKMGQRDLQSKFKLVYGTATHSNNNDWLRRKLYEAIGAAPIKAATKAKPRKASSKPRKSPPSEAQFHGSSADLMERRSRRIADVKPPLDAHKRSRALGSGGSLPGSPVVGRSVLDMHRYLAHDATTSASEDTDGTEAWEGEDTEEDEAARQTEAAAAMQQQQQQQPSSAEDSEWGAQEGSGAARIGPFAAASSRILPQGAALLSRRAHNNLSGSLFRRTSSAGLLGMASINLDMLQLPTNDVWGSDAWADAALKAAAARRAPTALPGMEDDDVMLLPMDLSAFDEDAMALL